MRNTKSTTVLLVEDDASISDLVRHILSREGWSVRRVCRVADALALLRVENFGAILLDYRLPDGEPWAIVDAANAVLPRIPVVMMTALGSEVVAAEALHRGVLEYVRKADEFRRELPAALERVTKVAGLEESLHFSDAVFKLVAANLTDMIVVADLNGAISYISAACQTMLGYSPQELQAIIGIDLVHPDDQAEVINSLRTIGKPREDAVVYRCRHKAGGLRWLESNVSVVNNKTTGASELVVISRDVSQRKQAEQQLLEANEALQLASQRVAEASRAKSEFLAAMSHEIRTPMNAILGMTDLLNETELDGVQRDYVNRCQRAGSNLLTLINDILDLSKIESGRFDLEQVPFDLEDLLDSTMDLIAPRAQLKRVAFHSCVWPETPLHLVGDPVRLQQVLINLLGNAVKFTESGQIVLTVAPEVGGRPGHLRFEVADTGVGIPADKLQTVFDDFTQAESSTTRRFGGTGLGLGIARRLVTRMGGKLGVASVLGQGSTFTFDAVFPIDPRPQAPDLPLAAYDLAGRRVLVADDNPTNRLILSHLCSTWGMLPVEADSGSAAHALMLASTAMEPFSLVILDVLMPHMGGFEALEKIRVIDPNIPVIMTTSSSRSGDLTKAKSLGVSAFAVKPVRRRDLLQLVLVALSLTSSKHKKGSNGSPARIKAARKDDAPPRILIADDSEDNRFLVSVYLSDQSCVLKFVENGAEALDIFEKESFDVVLMDIHMPVMDGLQATQLIRAYESKAARRPTPILALTADALVEDVERSHAVGCSGHLTKPISKDKLVNAIENARYLAT